MSEQNSLNEHSDQTKSGAITAGVDVGAVSTKAVILLDGSPYASSEVATRVPKDAALAAIEEALAKANLKMGDIRMIVATGRGRSQVSFAHATVSEIACAAKGAVHVWGPSVRTVLDAGGQSCRVIQCTEKGDAIDFLWNDKCAAGIGRSLETFAGLMGKETATVNKAGPEEAASLLSDFCPVYAQSEALDLMRNQVPAEQIAAAFYYAMAKRISTLVARSGVRGDFVMVGGLAKNPGITERVEGILKTKNLAPKTGWDPAFTVALGAALLARTASGKKR